MMNKARILAADDHSIVLEGVKTVLAEHFNFLGTVSDGRSLVETALRLKPDLILLDVSMPLLNGFEAARQIKASLPEVKLVFFTMHSERPYMQAAFEIGAEGYVLKETAPKELLNAVQAVLAGHFYLPAGLPVQFSNSRDPRRLVRSLTLTAREREVLQLIAEGRSGKEISDILGISVKTTEYHKENIKRKLGVKTTAELTRNAIALGLIEGGKASGGTA
jgi:DNA-binding NarL/FixJ family response regulator